MGQDGHRFYENQPQLSTVGCDRWADWSISPLSRPVDPERGVTLEARREGDENGRSIWIYQLVLDESGEVTERLPLREICWILADEDDDQVLDISPLVARPERNTTSQLSAEFKEFGVVWD
ncbi:hypothetical protein RRF57_012331 [Xylaria bambusicola]|uniref:Uncharacterized protein n=1 Tax=Xylaria bambusicola TaxID=326684 RepID=A0AAN7V5I1_9PEZI